MSVYLCNFRDHDGPALLAVHVRAILATRDIFYTEAERRSWAHGLAPDGYARARDRGETFAVATTADDAVVGFCSWSATQIIGLYV